jgi:SPP1 family predicted phage head-tail adaptor
VRAGYLRHQVTIERQPEAADSFGQNQASGAAVVTGPVWASIEPLRGTELVSARQLSADVTHRVTLRAPGLSVQASDVIVTVAGGRRLELTEVMDWMQRGIELQVLAIEDKAQV